MSALGRARSSVTASLTRTIAPTTNAKGSAPLLDWLLAARLAGRVAGEGEARWPRVELAPLAADATRRVIDYTRLTPTRELPAPEGVGRREWIAANLESMRQLLEPVLDRAGEEMGPLRPAMSLGVSVVSTIELGLVVGYLAQRVLGQYELVLLEDPDAGSPPRLLFVLPNLGAAIESLDAPEDEFLTWVTLHEVTHAVQFAGVPWLQQHMAELVQSMLHNDGAAAGAIAASADAERCRAAADRASGPIR